MMDTHVGKRAGKSNYAPAFASDGPRLTEAQDGVRNNREPFSPWRARKPKSDSLLKDPAFTGRGGSLSSLVSSDDEDDDEVVVVVNKTQHRQAKLKRQHVSDGSLSSLVSSDDEDDGPDLEVASPPVKSMPELRSRVENGMAVVKGAASHIPVAVMYDAIKEASNTDTYWTVNRGPHGYVNGEILNSHANNVDHAGAVIMKESGFFKAIKEVAGRIAPFVKRWDRGFVNVRRPADLQTGTCYGHHPAHLDTPKSSLILSFRFNYQGEGPAGSIIYSIGPHASAEERLEIAMEHGDVGVYTGDLHHVSTAGNVYHQVPPNQSTAITQVTVLLETQAELDLGFIQSLKNSKPFTRLPTLSTSGLPPKPALSQMLIPSKQIEHEQSSHQRFSQAERSRGGKTDAKPETKKRKGYKEWETKYSRAGESSVAQHAQTMVKQVAAPPTTAKQSVFKQSKLVSKKKLEAIKTQEELENVVRTQMQANGSTNKDYTGTGKTTRGGAMSSNEGKANGGANSAPPTTRGGIYSTSRDEQGRQRQFEATIKSCRHCTARKRLKWGNGKNLSFVTGPGHRADCPSKPSYQHSIASTPAACGPLWLLDDQGNRVEELTEEEYEERYHPKQ